MPLVSRHAGPADPTGTRPSARRVMRLLLCQCLGWLWLAAPVVAQDQVPPPAVEVKGPYRNLAENHAGTFHLRREEGVVYATFRTDRSPVQFLARDQPEALLTVPAGFRPAVAVTWEVSAQSVQADGTLRDHPDRRVLRMRVDTAGQVRYVDDPGVDGVGYLGYHTTLAWPLAGTEPHVCEYHWMIREGILAAVRAMEDTPVSCSQVDWTRLAGIRTLFLDTPDSGMEFARHDLLGLTNLAALQVSAPRATYPAELLAHTPRLQTLRMEETTLEDLPADLFRHTPLLEALHLEGAHPAAGLARLLTHAPRLTRLTVASSTPLPEMFLAAVPQLTHLTIRDGLEPCATPDLLAPVPDLRHVAVRMAAEDGELACLGRALRLHAPALAELHLELRDLQGLEAGVLPELPRLTRLTLDVGDRQLHGQLLAEAPELTHLALHGGTPGLPAGFLAHTPRLTSLSLQAGNLKHVSPDLLVPVPDLRQVRVDTGDATYLPTWFQERVTELRMGTGGRSVLPWDFLMHAPHLEVLHLTAHSLASLPEGFLTHAPRLETFHLDAGHRSSKSALESFPEYFLTHAPSLVELRLRVPALQAFPPSFLGHAPRLETLALETTLEPMYTRRSFYKEKLRITSLPANFLIHVPRLRHLDLEPLGHVKAFPPGFLSGSPQLRYLNLDARSVSSLPPDFLNRYPHLETVRLRAQNMPILPRGFLSRSPRLMDLKLDLQRVEALPEGFLADTPRLWNLELDVQGIETLPTGFLTEVPQLAHLNLRAHNLPAWPADFLAHAPRIQTLSLAMPLLEPTLTPDHRLWELLQATSLRVKVTRPDPVYYDYYDYFGYTHPECGGGTILLGNILEVKGRAPDDQGRTLLTVRLWRERELFVTYWGRYCLHLIDASFTMPTLAVCAADWDPAYCDPVRVPPYGDPEPFRG